jgi:hypothetical protein
LPLGRSERLKKTRKIVLFLKKNNQKDFYVLAASRVGGLPPMA